MKNLFQIVIIIKNFPKPRLGETEILSSPIMSIGAGTTIVEPVVDRKDLTENQQNYQDQVSFIVQNMRQDHNQEPKKSVFTKANGDFDQREAWLSAVEIINRKKQGFKGNYFTEFNYIICIQIWIITNVKSEKMNVLCIWKFFI